MIRKLSNRLTQFLRLQAPSIVTACAVGAVCLFTVSVLPDRTDYYGKQIGEIQYYGLRNLSPGEIQDLLPIRPGDPLTEQNLNESVKAMFDSGYFANVIVKVQNLSGGTIRVNFQVIELPRIEEIQLLGNEELYEADLLSVLPVSEGKVYSLQKAKDGVETLKSKYTEEGFFLAEVWLHAGDIDPETNTVKLRYIIDEGQNIPISRINILGAKNLDPAAIIAILDHKEEGFLEDGIFQESTFEQDKFKVLAYAKSNGYVNAELDPNATGYEIRWRNPDRPEEGRVVVITYKLVEGDIRYFGGYSMEHDPTAINLERNPPERKISGPEDLVPVYKPKDLLAAMEFNPDESGEIFDEGKFFRDRNTLQQAYSSQGYVFAQIQPYFSTFELTEENLDRYEQCAKSAEGKPVSKRSECERIGNSINFEELRELLEDDPAARGRTLRHVHFVIRENGLAYIENIIIKGMVKTQENVIRRELLVKEGQLFNSALVERSREIVFNLGFFKEVNLEMRPGSDDSKMNLIIDVEEQPTGTVTMGGGYGTASGFSIFTELGENNLNGTGQRISGKLQYGPDNRQLNISWTDPWIYEACQDSTGRYWANKSEELDNAAGVSEIKSIADTFQNQYSEVGKLIAQYSDEAGTNLNQRELDALKARIRMLISPFLEEEEDCYRSAPRPWALSLFAGYSSQTIPTVSIRISDDENDFFEGAEYDITSLGVGAGISHTFWVNWAHYHRYSPSWSVASRPTALVNNEVIRRTNLGWQFKSSLTNCILYDNRDNVFNPTTGRRMDLSVETVGQLLGGDDHYNQYKIQLYQYWWPFDYTFFGLIRSNTLKRWRVVIEGRASGTFTHEAAPGGSQNKEINPYLEIGDRLFLGGYETVRGYDFRQDRNFPAPWYQFNGANHMLLASLELRFPIEPSILWWTFFLDAGSMFLNLGELTGDNAEYVENYEELVAESSGVSNDPVSRYLFERYNQLSLTRYPFDSFTAWNDPRNAVLSQRNVALDRFVYSWGFGLRIQIPVLPLRLFMAQKLYYSDGKLKPIPNDDKFQFVFGIGDFRF